MPRTLFTLLLTLMLAACSSGGDTHDVPGLREVSAANQCMALCHSRYESCAASPSGFDSGDTCGTGVATQRDGKCDRIVDADLRRSCQASADYCRNRSPALRCGEERDQCMRRCGY